MGKTYPPELKQFVDQELASGQYEDESALIAEALRVFQELKTRHQELRSDVERSIAQADRGEVTPMDSEATKGEARRRFADMQ